MLGNSSSTTPSREGEAVDYRPSSSLFDDSNNNHYNEDTGFHTPKRTAYTPHRITAANFDILNTPPQRIMLPPRPPSPTIDAEEELEDEESSSLILNSPIATTPSRRAYHRPYYHQQYSPDIYNHRNHSSVATTPQRQQRQRRQFQQQYHCHQPLAAASPYREQPHYQKPLSSIASTPQRTLHKANYNDYYSRTPYRPAVAATVHAQQTPRRPRFPPTETVAPKRKSTKPIITATSAAVETLDEKESTHFPVTYNPTQEPIKAYLRIRPKFINKSATCALSDVASNSVELDDEEKSKDLNDENKENKDTNEKSIAIGPYLKILNQHEILMTPTEDSNAFRNRNSAQPERYKFTDILNDSVSQYTFFTKTTLPLIQDVLEKGENALLFAYGVTNSGKTFTIMGTREEPGILPRTLDVIFNSIGDNLASDETKLKPCMHSGVRSYTHAEEEHRDVIAMHQHQMSQAANNNSSGHSDKQAVVDLSTAFLQDEQQRSLTVLIDKGYEYGIWVSFAEIYTEKIYDLLVSPPPDENTTTHNGRKRKHPLGNGNTKRKALALKYETNNSKNKYIAGLKQVRVKSVEEAYAVLFQGLSNRAQYSTLVNQTSSRSHSIFTIAVVKIPIDDTDKGFVIEDPMYSSVSKFQIVDLAGSERYRNTLNQGQRLREAGQINKSLMVLGQCMETLRLNQLKVAVGKKPDMVPYRHSKLTELFKSSFEGNGKAVMVVNVNPYGTGFDENSHVMKFSAVAKDVATWKRAHPKLNLKGLAQQSNVKKRQRRRPAPPPSSLYSTAATTTLPTLQQQQDEHYDASQQQYHHVYHGIDDLMADDEEENEEEEYEKVISPSDTDEISEQRQEGHQSTIKKAANHLNKQEDRDDQTLTNIDEDDDDDVEESEDSEEDEGDVEKDPFVETLFEQLEDLRSKWLEAEARCERMESEIREQVTKETESELKTMEDIYMKSLRQDNELNEARIKQRLGKEINKAVAKKKLQMEEEKKNRERTYDYTNFKELEDKQEAISNQLNHFIAYMSEHERTRHQLLEKITELEKAKQKQTETIHRLNLKLQEQDMVLGAMKEEKIAAQNQSSSNAKQESTDKDNDPHAHMRYLEWKKRLRQMKLQRENDPPGATH